MKTIIITLILIFPLSVSSQTWAELNSGVTTTLTSVWAQDPTSNVWICGYNGTVIKSTNSGMNWINLTGNGIPTNVSLINIHSTTDGGSVITAGYIGANTFVYRTTNGGANWTQVFTQTNGFINASWLLSNNVWFMQGDPVVGRWSLWKSTNLGAIWDSSGLYLQQTGNEAGWNNSLFSYQNKIWFGTNNSRIYFSTNYASSWSIQSTSSEVNTYTVWFGLSVTTGYAGGSSLLRTTNNGVNWGSITSLGSGNIGGFTGSGQFENRWYVRSSNQIYGSILSSSWQVLHTAPSGTYRHIASNIYPGWFGFVYAVRNNGGISRAFYSLEKIQPISTEIPEKFSLYQNYPNPFNPRTKIRFSIPSQSPLSQRGEGGLITLKVYDILGREVATLVNEQLKPGTYEVEFPPASENGRNYPSGYASGVYFYTLTADNFKETKKMVLTK